MQETHRGEEMNRLILGRRSIRVFRPGAINEGILERLLQTAMAAPSAVAKDPWRFVVVRQRATLEAVAPVLSGGEMLLQAGTAIAVCGDTEAAHDRQLSYLLQDCSAAIENLLLSAHAHALGACWLGVHPREKRISALRSILGLPPSVLPVACIAIGHPAENKPARTRFNPDYVHWETWSGKG